jgi:hypothetical protein
MKSDMRGTESIAIIGIPPLDKPIRKAANPATIQYSMGQTLR